eukprot:TRINITY_DN21300_c0_g1_i1.p1 TRINITY_DN21300_c0_g1~~TRINITY_DN21300_c0_g1_i1.p1  ORF type:complete len:184 (+),score=23.82 TRINITY_DN21300_c0_g1_i1:108-659(+)
MAALALLLASVATSCASPLSAQGEMDASSFLQSRAQAQPTPEAKPSCDTQLDAFLAGFPNCTYIPSPTDCSAAENVTIGDQASMIFNSAEDKVVLLLHGWDLTCVNQAENYCDLAQAISELGYQVVLPRGNSGPPTQGQVMHEEKWALQTAQAVRDHFSGHRIAVVGHSLGGWWSDSRRRKSY